MTCSSVLREQGKAYPRTCEDHGLHCPPTPHEVEQQVGIEHPPLEQQPEQDVDTAGTILDPADEQVDETPTGPHLILELEGERALFEAKGQRANQLLLVKYMDALGTSGFPTTDAVVHLALGQVKDRARLEDYLERHGFAPDFDQALYDALSECWRGETLLPLERSSDSSGATSGT